MNRFETSRLGALLESRGVVRSPIHILGDVGSTQDEALDLAERSAPGGTIVMARSQTAGRGRHSRAWFSPPGCMYASVLLRPEWSVEHWPLLSLVAGVAVVEALQDEGIRDVRLKWPNDCLAGGLKLAGVLAEARSSRGIVVIGIGLNASFGVTPPSSELAPRAVALCDLVPGSRDLHPVCASVMERVWTACIRCGSAPVIDPERVGRLLWTSGDVAVSGVTGRVVGVARTGELLLEQADGTAVAVLAGEVEDAGCD